MKLIFFAIACVGLGSSIRGLIEAIYQKKEKQRQLERYKAGMIDFADHLAKEYTVVGCTHTEGPVYAKNSTGTKNTSYYTAKQATEMFLATKNNLSS